MMNRVNEIIEKEIRPALASHGGDVEVTAFEDGILWVKLLGQCANCPAAKETNENLITTTLVSAIPEIKEVKLDESMDQSMLDMARKLLNHEA